MFEGNANNMSDTVIENTQQQDMKSVFMQISPSVSSFLKSHNAITMSAFRNAFKENIHFTVVKSEQIHVKASSNTLDILKIMLMNEPMTMNYSSTIKSWLTKNNASWLTFINSLIEKYIFAAYTEADFSKSYFFIAPHSTKEILGKISDFLALNEAEVLPEDTISEKSSPVSVYQPFVDYLLNNEKMALILKSDKQSSSNAPFIEIDTSKESFEILKSRLKMVASQSCLLNASQAELLTECKNEILSDFQRNYQIIGNVFQPDSPMNSLVLNHQTEVICIVCSEPDYCPVDNFIGLKCSFSPSQAEFTVAKEFPSGDTIWKGETWNLPFNQRFYVTLPLMQRDNTTPNFKDVLEECFQMLDDDYSFNSKITGISLTVTNPRILNQFCSDLLAALQSFDQMHLYGSSRKCIAVMVESPEIQVKITETISELGNVKTKGFDDATAGALLGAIPKGSKRTQQEIQEDKPVLWIQLSDFSGNFSENLSHAVDTLIHKVSKEDKNLIKHVAKIHRSKLESLLFFFEEKIIEALPDIKDQLAKSEEYVVTIVTPTNSSISIRQKFKKLLKLIQRKVIDVKSIQEKSHLHSIVTECKLNFPLVKCHYMEERSSIFIESLNLENVIMVEGIINNQLGLPPNQNTSFKLPQGILPENFESVFESGQTKYTSNFFNIRVLHDEILSVDADAIVCPVFSNIDQISYACQLILSHAGTNVKTELMTCYYQQPYKKLPEGEVVVTSGGNLKYKLIIYVNCLEDRKSQYDEYSIQKNLTSAMCALLNKADEYQIQSLALPILGSGILNTSLDLCFEACLSGMTSFMNQHSPKHLQVISFVDNQESNCVMIMNLLMTYQIPFKDNIAKKKKITALTISIACPVCFKPVTNSKIFYDCEHKYCSGCIRDWEEVMDEKCPLCLNMKPQPPSEMMVTLSEKSLPGFEAFPTYKIHYIIPSGIQQNIHPNPGKIYTGTVRTAYLPASEEGESILKMLQKAFKEHLIFTVGNSLSTKMSDVVIWNGILHKSRRTGGPLQYGYPDPLYLNHVFAQLLEIGITPESVQFETVQAQIKMTAFS